MAELVKRRHKRQKKNKSKMQIRDIGLPCLGLNMQKGRVNIIHCRICKL